VRLTRNLLDRHGTKEADVKALVVYESMYGNTAAIGEAIAAALRERGLDVEESLVTKIDAARAVDVDLLLVGGPTHVHGMSRVATRNAAVNDEKNTFTEPTVDPGLREWLARLPEGGGRLAGAFDTRFGKPRFLTGSAAKGIKHRLRERGFQFVAEPESFLVSTENRLLEGEVERARTWAEKIAERARDERTERHTIATCPT